MLPMILSIHFKVHMTNNMNSEDIHTQATLSHSCKSHPYLPGFLHCSLQSVCVSTSVVYVCRWSPQSFVLFRIKMPLKHFNSTLKLRLIKTHFSGGSVSFKSCMTHTWWRTVVVCGLPEDTQQTVCDAQTQCFLQHFMDAWVPICGCVLCQEGIVCCWEWYCESVHSPAVEGLMPDEHRFDWHWHLAADRGDNTRQR